MRYISRIVFLLVALAVFVLPAVSYASNGYSKNTKHYISEASAAHESTTHFGRGYRYDENGWIYVHIEGEPYERGFQHGMLVADAYAQALRTTKAMTYQTMGLEYDFFVKHAVRLHKHKIPKELIEEMKGIADGLTAAGVPSTLDDIIGWNGYSEITGYWWPNAKSKYVAAAPGAYGKGECSAFIATGSATKDGKIVIGHETFDDFWESQYANLILDIVPSKGNAIIMQATPGYIDSMTDFFITGAGIVGVETSIAGFSSYDTKGIPEYVRIRMAMQYGEGLDEFVEILNKGNNGGVANVWLLGDINTGEIAQFEQGLIYTNYQKKKDGYWTGNNAVVDPRIRNLECVGVGYNDIRRQTGGRRTRWPANIGKYVGRIDAEVGKRMLADHYDVYERRVKAGANTICAHYDQDPRKSFSGIYGVWPNPYTPAGSLDAKVTTSDMARDMKLWARFGRACGETFNADSFLKMQPQWNWQQGYLKSRPHQPFTLFQGTTASAD